MVNTQCIDGTLQSRMFAAEGKFVIDHDGGRLVAQLTYLSGTPGFVATLRTRRLSATLAADTIFSKWNRFRIS